jgi:hypothetical protein
MALKSVTLKRINGASSRFVAWLKYHAIGPQALTKKELKDLVMAGMIDTGAPKTAVARSYLQTHQQLTVSPAPKPIRQGSIDFLERQFSRYAEKAGQQFTADILGQIEAQIMPFVDKQEGKHVYDMLRDKSKHAKNLRGSLQGKVKDWSGRWKMIVNTELSRATNYGALDAIFTNNKGQDPKEIYCYKVGPNDGATCKYCKKFWFMPDGVTPKVYKLSELITNGTNIGRKQADWKPTVDITHPNGRHTLVQLQPGWGFVNGHLQYIEKDHNEHGRQKGS